MSSICHTMQSWERPLLKTDTHIKAIEIAALSGLKIWKVYEIAINDLMECYDKKQRKTWSNKRRQSMGTNNERGTIEHSDALASDTGVI